MATSAPEPPTSGSYRYLAIGKYQVLSHLASGGMGAVYKARDTELGREVALKILSPDLAANPVRLERFRREARHSAKLRHENIATLYEIGEANGLYFLALEFVDGIDLHQHINREGLLDAEEAVQILTQAVQALYCAHLQGIVHRDIKPSNILLTQRDGQLLVKLTDFGCARQSREEEFRLTEAGHTVGTVDYMPSEQARDGRLADIRSDIYSLGCTLYHMLAGQPPFAEGTLTERIYKHAEAEVPDIRPFNSRVPGRLRAILKRMLAKKPDDRYQTPADLLKDLVHALDESSVADPDVVQEESSPLLPVTTEQRQAAAGMFDRAREVMAGENQDYAIKLLLNCCQLDPANLIYRRTLRKLEKLAAKQSGRPRSTWLKGLAGKAKFTLARKRGEHRKVLELGEELLVRDPTDAATLGTMAEAALALELPRLALWFLEQARKANPGDVSLSRTAARICEQQGNLAQAIALWEVVREADPGDFEAKNKVKDLHASETIARGNYTESIEAIDAVKKRSRTRR